MSFYSFGRELHFLGFGRKVHFYDFVENLILRFCQKSGGGEFTVLAEKCVFCGFGGKFIFMILVGICVFSVLTGNVVLWF